MNFGSLWWIVLSMSQANKKYSWWQLIFRLVFETEFRISSFFLAKLKISIQTHRITTWTTCFQLKLANIVLIYPVFRKMDFSCFYIFRPQCVCENFLLFYFCTSCCECSVYANSKAKNIKNMEEIRILNRVCADKRIS